jgi:Ca2+-binding EF-hand superfamily protein
LDLLKQEIVTIFRELDPHHTGTVKMTKLLKFLMDHDGSGHPANSGSAAN